MPPDGVVDGLLQPALLLGKYRALGVERRLRSVPGRRQGEDVFGNLDKAVDRAAANLADSSSRS